MFDPVDTEFWPFFLILSKNAKFVALKPLAPLSLIHARNSNYKIESFLNI